MNPNDNLAVTAAEASGSGPATTAQLAAFIAELSFASLPPDVIAQAKDSLLDTLGVALAGVAEPGGHIIRQHTAERGGRAEASLIGGGPKVPAIAAASANGTLAHIVGFSDFSVPTLLHPSVAVVPAALAIGEARGVDGKTLLLGHVLGVETSCKIGRALTRAFTERGFHPCAVVGAFGATAAAARISGLDAVQTAHALGIAGVCAGGIKVALGSMAKAYAVGHAAESGVAAAELASLGYTGADNVLEGPDGFFQTFGDGIAAPDLSSALGNPFDFTAPGIAIKPYPSCTRSHPAIDAALQVVADPAFDSRAIAEIECDVAPAVLDVVKVMRPRNPMEAKFSLPFCLSAALLDSKIVIETFRDDRLNDPRVQALMHRVSLRASESLTAQGPFAARVLVRMSNGSELHGTADRNLWDAAGVPSPAKRAQLLAKFESCAGRVLTTRLIADVIAIVDGLEDEPDLRRLMAVVGTSTAQNR